MRPITSRAGLIAAVLMATGLGASARASGDLIDSDLIGSDVIRTPPEVEVVVQQRPGTNLPPGGNGPGEVVTRKPLESTTCVPSEIRITGDLFVLRCGDEQLAVATGTPLAAVVMEAAAYARNVAAQNREVFVAGEAKASTVSAYMHVRGEMQLPAGNTSGARLAITWDRSVFEPDFPGCPEWRAS